MNAGGANLSFIAGGNGRFNLAKTLVQIDIVHPDSKNVDATDIGHLGYRPFCLGYEFLRREASRLHQFTLNPLVGLAQALLERYRGFPAQHLA